MTEYWEDGPLKCTTCGEQRMGRFCNIVPTANGWTQGRTHVHFYCWRCYPYGSAARPREDNPALKPPSAIAEEQQRGAA